jgi:hypothetical protein
MPGKTKAKKEVVRGKFFAFLGATSLSHDMDRDHVHLGHSYGRNCLLLGWSHQPYEEAIKAVHETRPEVSEKTIGKVLAQSMVKLFHQHNVREDADPEADAPILDSILGILDSSAVSAEVTAFLELLKSQIEMWTAFVFLEGVELKGLAELPLGAATLYPRKRGPLHDALKEVKTVQGLDDIPQYIERFAGHCCCYLTIDIEGENGFATQRASRQAQDIASVLNLYVVSSRHRASFYERICVLGQPTTTRRQLVLKRTPSIGKDAPAPRYSYSEQYPPARRYAIDPAQVQQWKEHGLDKVLECIGLQDIAPGSAESRIRNAIVWYGRAMNAYTEDEQFIGLMIALESLLVADENVSITQRLADEVSALLGTDFKSRECISRRTKELYDLRGRIVHAGIPASQENLFILDELVADTILAFVRREIPAQQGRSAG